MATLKANGAEVFRFRNRNSGLRPWFRVMLSGKILASRSGTSGFRVVRRMKKGVTFGELADAIADNFECEWTNEKLWRDRQPRSTRRSPQNRGALNRALCDL